MFTAIKKLHFCYGHRLLDYNGKCAHLHGHNAEVEVEISGASLDRLGMVVDFGDIAARLEVFIKESLDHKLLLRRDDPLAELLLGVGEPVVRMDVNPTAENLARMIFEEAAGAGLPVSAVRFWETPRACAEYRRDVGESRIGE